MSAIIKPALPLLLFCALLFSAPLISAQDDLYGDIRKKTSTPKKEKSKKTVVQTTLHWDDSVSTNYSIIYFYRKFEGSNVLPISIMINNKPIGNLNSDSQLNYKLFSQGKILITANNNGETNELLLDIINGQKYFVTVNLTNKNSIEKADEADAYKNFRPGNVIRISEQTAAPVKKQPTPVAETSPDTITPSDVEVILPAEEAVTQKTIQGATGFIISPEGYVITNYHVIHLFKHFYVKGISGNSDKKYKAKVVLEDKINDLALLKITDSVAIKNIPYGFTTSVSDTGEVIYTLGYPMPAEKIKVSEGLITAQSGYEGNINSYEISTPLNPFNSGGPVCDWNGNILGISNVKIIGGDTTSYAIKIYILKKFLVGMEKPINLPFPDNTSDKTFSEQAPLIQKYVLRIETE